MSTQSNALSESDLRRLMTNAIATTRPLYWSVRRELWENRYILIAPLVLAGVVLFGFLVSTKYGMGAVLALDPAKQRAAIEMDYDSVAFLLLVTAFVVGVFYSLDALHSERRDRSILFWKSLPVSDLSTVLSKASIPLAVLPLIIFAVILAVQMIMLVLTSAVLLVEGRDVAALWIRVPLFDKPVGLLYSLAAIALWHAPIYSWLLLVSAWARRAVFLFAVLPVLVAGVFEQIAFHTFYTALALKYLCIGWIAAAFDFKTKGMFVVGPMSLDPAKFLSTPSLWIGLVSAALFLTVAARLRRYRGPI